MVVFRQQWQYGAAVTVTTTPKLMAIFSEKACLPLGLGGKDPLSPKQMLPPSLKQNL